MISPRDYRVDAIRASLAKIARKPVIRTDGRKVLPLASRVSFVPSTAPLPASQSR